MFGSERQRGILYQVLLLAIVVGVGWYLVSNTLHNLSSRQIQVGFGFLGKEAGFEIAPTRPVPGTVDLWIDREGGHLVRMRLDGQGVEVDATITDLDDPTIVVEPPTPDQIAPSPQFSDLGEIPAGSPEG